jgi:hypothetical protein
VHKDVLLVGQGIPHQGGFAWRSFNLKNNRKLHQEAMPSKFAYRSWGACDASPLIHGNSRTFFWPTESGVIYRGKLKVDGIDSIQQFRYKSKNMHHQGIESSPAAVGNLGYFTDNGGNVLCVDLTSMQTRWHFFNMDDSDASPVIQMKNNVPYVYVGNEVDKQGAKGLGGLRKLNGLTGKMEWKYEKTCYSVFVPKPTNGGMLSTPCMGKQRASHLIWTIMSNVSEKGMDGMFVCIDNDTGRPVYEIPLENYSWVSPIAVYDEKGNPYVYFSDVAGNVFLLDGLTGKTIYREFVGYVFESSPVAWNNRIIQPARGDRIFSLLIE